MYPCVKGHFLNMGGFSTPHLTLRLKEAQLKSPIGVPNWEVDNDGNIFLKRISFANGLAIL